MVFASSDVGVETIAVLGFDAEEMALILMILAERLLKWMWSHEDDMLLPHALAFCGQMQ